MPRYETFPTEQLFYISKLNPDMKGIHTRNCVSFRGISNIRKYRQKYETDGFLIKVATFIRSFVSFL